MGHRFQAVPDSSVRNAEKDEKKEKLKLKTSTSSEERFIEHDGTQGNEVFEFVSLVESSESSQAMKALLLGIINANRCEELKPFLKDRPTETNRLKKKQGKMNIDDRPRRQSVRRSSKSGRSESSEQGTEFDHRKSTRTRLTEQGIRATSQLSTRVNNLQLSPGTSLRRSRQSDSCLRKSHRDPVLESHDKKSKLSSSSSLLQLRTNRRSDMNRRRTMVNLNQCEMQTYNANASWDPVPGAMTSNKHRSNLDGNLKSTPVSSGNQNVNFESTCSPKGASGIDKSKKKALGKICETKFNLSDKKAVLSDYSDGGEDKSFPEMNKSKILNSFAQFEPTGQVAYRKQTVRLHDLVDNLTSNRDFDGEPSREYIISNVEANDKTMPEKKGLRKYLAKQLTKKIVSSRDKQSVASESANDIYKSLSDENDFIINDLHDSTTSNTLQSSIAS